MQQQLPGQPKAHNGEGDFNTRTNDQLACNDTTKHHDQLLKTSYLLTVFGMTQSLRHRRHHRLRILRILLFY